MQFKWKSNNFYGFLIGSCAFLINLSHHRIRKSFGFFSFSSFLLYLRSVNPWMALPASSIRILHLSARGANFQGPWPRAEGALLTISSFIFCKEDGCWKSMEEWESDETELEQHRGKFETSRGVREKWRIWERREEGELQRLKMKQKQRRPGSYQLSSLLFFFSFSILFSFFRESFCMFVPNFSSIDLPCLALPSFSFLLSLPFMGSRNASKFDRLS